MRGLAQLGCFSSAPLRRRLMDGLLSVRRCAKEMFLPWSYSFGKNSARQNLSAFLQHHTNRTDKGPRPGFVPPEISINNRLLYFSLLWFFLTLHPSPFFTPSDCDSVRHPLCSVTPPENRQINFYREPLVWKRGKPRVYHPELLLKVLVSQSVPPCSPAFKWSKTCFSSTASWRLLLWVATVT